MSNKIQYPKKKINKRTVILCMNSNSESKWYNGKMCENWVPINESSIEALCSDCVIKTLQ